MTGRPRGAKEFQRLLQRHAAEIGQLPQRVMHLVRIGVVCEMLDDVRHPDGGHLFIVKGGTAMQLRLGIRARATTDLDVVFAGTVDGWLARFDEATMERTWNGFTVARKSPATPIEVDTAGYNHGGCRFNCITRAVSSEASPWRWRSTTQRPVTRSRSGRGRRAW